MTNARRVSLLLAALLLPPPPAGSEGVMDLKVSPAVSLEPAYVTVRVTVVADPENRSLEVVAEAPEFRRSSQIPLDGQRAPRVSTFEFRALPTGIYEVTGTLVGDRGPRARVARTLVVAAGRGDVRRR
jgi:hypothetical protein